MKFIPFDKAMENGIKIAVIVGSAQIWHKGLYVERHVDRATLPAGWHVYEIQESKNSEAHYGRLKNGIVKDDFRASFLTKDDLSIPEGGKLRLLEDFEGLAGGMEDDEFQYTFG